MKKIIEKVCFLLLLTFCLSFGTLCFAQSDEENVDEKKYENVGLNPFDRNGEDRKSVV